MLSILSEGNTTLDEYPELLRRYGYGAVDCVGASYVVSAPDHTLGCPPRSHYYGYYPVGAIAVALPVFVGMDVILRMAGPWAASLLGSHSTPVILAFLERDYDASHALVELVIASFLIGVAAAFVFLTARLYLPVGGSVLLALLFAFGTAAWSTGSRALWQHGPDMLMLSVALYLLAASERKPALLAWCAAPLTVAYFVRPTSLLVLTSVGAFVCLHRRAWILRWTLLGLATAAPFIAYNVAIYHRLLQPYFTRQHFLEASFSNVGRFLSALAGQCISPSRGVFVFSPFLLFSIYGIVLAFRKGWLKPLHFYLTGALVLHWVVISAFADWTAGFSFGPRYFSDVIPIFMFFLIPVFSAFLKGEVRRPAAALFVVCALAGFLINLRGATNWAVEEWNNPDVNPARAWDWHDPQFLRGL